jgi:hypothetical protein
MTRIVATVLSFVSLVPLATLAQTQCSTQILKGQYIFAGRGFIEPGEPGVERVHRGVLVFDGTGNVSGKQSSSRAGKIGHEKLQGTYKLDADCTGTMTFGSVANPGGQIHWDVYATQDGRTGHMIRTDNGSMAVRSFEK